MTLRGLRVRERVNAAQLHAMDPLAEAVVTADAWARSRWPVLLPDVKGLTGLAQRKRSPIDAGLAAAMLERNRALGGSAHTLSNVERLARGEAVVAVAGQQPAPLGGPLYVIHKVASAVALARRVERVTGVPCVPAFWVASEDSDFAEIRGATIGDAKLVLHELELGGEHHHEGEMVGAIPAPALDPLHAASAEAWAALPGAHAVAALLKASRARATDLGEAFAALYLELFAEHGLVVVDARWPALRAAARPVIERYIDQAESLARAVNQAGEENERRFGKRALAAAALDSWLFAIQGTRREKVAVRDARPAFAQGALSPSVALRPIIQDHVLHAVAMATGPGEVAYLAQLGEAFRAMGVEPSVPAARLSATWLPPAAIEMLAASGAGAAELVAHADAVVRRWAEQRMPPDVLARLHELRANTSEAIRRFAAEAARVDSSLPQLVESARGKIDYQLGRIEEGTVGKIRTRIEREHPEVTRLRYYLMPSDKPQERRLASLEPVAYRGRGVAADLVEAAGEHLDAVAAGQATHALIEL